MPRVKLLGASILSRRIDVPSKRKSAVILLEMIRARLEKKTQPKSCRAVGGGTPLPPEGRRVRGPCRGSPFGYSLAKNVPALALRLDLRFSPGWRMGVPFYTPTSLQAKSMYSLYHGAFW